jgi:hypothetical protein
LVIFSGSFSIEKKIDGVTGASGFIDICISVYYNTDGLPFFLSIEISLGLT